MSRTSDYKIPETPITTKVKGAINRTVGIPNINVLLITTHGNYDGDDKNFESPMNFAKINSTSICITNYMHNDLISQIKDTIIEELEKKYTSDFRDVARRLSDKLWKLEKDEGALRQELAGDERGDEEDQKSFDDYRDAEKMSYNLNDVETGEEVLEKTFSVYPFGEDPGNPIDDDVRPVSSNPEQSARNIRYLTKMNADKRNEGSYSPVKRRIPLPDMITLFNVETKLFVNILDEISRNEQWKQTIYVDGNNMKSIQLSSLLLYLKKVKDVDNIIICDHSCNSTWLSERGERILKRSKKITSEETGETVRGVPGVKETPVKERKKDPNKGGTKKSKKKINKYSRKKNLKHSSRKNKINNKKYTMKKRGGAEKSRTIVKMEQIDPVYLKIMLRTNIKGKANIGPFKIRQVMKDYAGENNIFFLRQLDFDNEDWDMDIDELRKSFTTPEKLVNAVDVYLIDKDFEKNYTKSQKDNIIQDNIAFLLRTYFPKNSIFYLDGKPHTIYGSQWDGHWTIKKRETNVYAQVEDKYDRYEVNLYLHLVPGESIPLYDSMKAYCQFRSKRIQDNIAEGSRLKRPDVYIQKDTVRDSYEQVKGTKDRLMDSLVNEELKRRLKEKYGK